MSRRRYRFTEAKARAARQPRSNGCRALLVVDNAPLQKAAWRDLCKARKLLEKASRDLHRHEEIDVPGFGAWLGATFPDLVSSARDLAMQFNAKERIVSAVDGEAFITRRSPRVIWQEWQQMQKKQSEDGTSSGGNTHANADGSKFGDGCDFDPWNEGANRQESEQGFEAFCAEMGLDASDPQVRAEYGAASRMMGFGDPRGIVRPQVDEVREIYRRLVQQLHPDRGGEWTPQRARVWHQVQEAWASRDADMLARLEAEWEIATDILGPTSSVGRLREALEEIHAARRDAESRVRRYRKMPEWRFSLSPPDRRRCEDLQRGLERERDMLRRQLDELEAIIAEWERPIKKRARRGKRFEPDWAVERQMVPTEQDLFAFDFEG
jgi:hypothetical protein